MSPTRNTRNLNNQNLSQGKRLVSKDFRSFKVLCDYSNIPTHLFVLYNYACGRTFQELNSGIQVLLK